MPWLKIKDEIEAKESKNTPTPETNINRPAAGQVELGSLPAPTVTPTSGPTVMPTSSPVPELNFKTQPQAPISVVSPGKVVPEADIEGPLPEEQAPDTERGANIPIPLVTKAPILSHQHFYESLEALSKEDPRILAKYISKYASSIQ